MQNHLSINLAAEMLERTRRTIKRALRHVPPDSHERGQPRWRLPKIIEALDSSGAPMTQPRHAEDTTPLADQVDALYKQFNEAFELVKIAPTLTKRRQLAIKLNPLLAQLIREQRELGLANGHDPELVNFRVDLIFNLLLRGFEQPCRWTYEQAHEHLDGYDGD